MATSILNYPALIQACSGLSNKVGREHSLIATGDSADNLVDTAATARGPRLAVTGTAADASSMSAQRKKLAVASVTVRVRGNARRIANALASSKWQHSNGGCHATVTIKDTYDATLIAAQTIHAAVLFADMRGYTGLAERLPPARVVSMLNEFFTVLERVTVQFGGQVFHMAGDGMMAGFGVRDPRRSGARAALAAGHAMLQRFAPVATDWRAEFAIVTGIGIGLHVGEVALGFLGPPGKQSINMIGDTVNVAARLCSRARAGEVLFSCAVAAALVDDGGGPAAGPKPFLRLPQFELRGRGELLDIWCVPAQECAGLKLPEAMPGKLRSATPQAPACKRDTVVQRMPSHVKRSVIPELAELSGANLMAIEHAELVVALYAAVTALDENGLHQEASAARALLHGMAMRAAH